MKPPELPPEPPRLEITLSSFPPFAAARNPGKLSCNTETNFCMPDCMRGYGQSVDRLDRSLVWSIKRLRAVTPSTLSEV
ncbi:hypothetical protein F2Q70_00031798 [Brassica cretica]|uniref:Uncharacterized protein n=1 Tax=Brassica cretica TaxID=69181 RepID=A0A8S9FHQ4_BRACR|nr:hypothetical protein F2Q70_00031798 [Brassica cretica]